MNNRQIECTAPTISKHLNNTDKQHEQQMAKKNQGKLGNDLKKSRKMKNKRQIAQQQQDPNAEMFEFMQEEVRSRLQCCQPGRELEILHNSLKPDYQTLWLKCMEVKRDLLFALQRFYPFVRLEIFGSTVMGIAFKDSDFDFFIELSREPLHIKPAAVIGKAMNILKHSGNFTNFLPISHARVPILKCYHIKTKMALDINFSDSYGILNSPIIARLLTIDARIYVLATILKFWAKIHDCVGKNRISNYALVWMVIFYLQQLPEPILPPIEDFQKRIQPYLVNNYNFAFDDRLRIQTNNQQRCSDLLFGFFKFYSTFDFESNVICPLYGKAYCKTDILANKLSEFQKYYDILSQNSTTPMQFNKCLVIQDPFEITHAIPGAIPHCEFRKIIYKFQNAADIINSELQLNGESNKLLLLLFDAGKFNQYVQQKMSNSVQKSGSKQQISVFKPLNTTRVHIKPTDYHLSIIREILTKEVNDWNATKIDSQAIHRSWSKHIVNFIILILREIFMLEIETIATNTANQPSTSKNVNAGSSNNSDNIDLQSELNDMLTKEFNIIGSRDVFLGRRQTKKITVNTLNLEKIESQERFKNISLKIQLKVAAKIKVDMHNFDEVTIEFIDLIKTKKNNFFKTFFTNFDQNLNNLLKIYLVHECGTVL